MSLAAAIFVLSLYLAGVYLAHRLGTIKGRRRAWVEYNASIQMMAMAYARLRTVDAAELRELMTLHGLVIRRDSEKNRGLN